MTAALGFLHVDDHVARNPIARAVAAQRLRAAVRNSQTGIYLLDDGDIVDADGPSWARVLYVAWLVLHARGQADSAAARVMRGAISTIEQLAKRGWAWRRIDAAAVDAGLTHARNAVDGAAAAEVRAAWAELDALERKLQRDGATRAHAAREAA